MAAGKAIGILRGSVLALGLSMAAPLSAASLSGDYLAGRQASFLGDYKAAADYYGRAIAYDPENPELIERTAFASLSMGDMERAVTLAERLTDMGYSSQIGHMAQIARMAQNEDYEGILSRIDQRKAIGPLVDGLMKAWAELGRGDMSAALVAFDSLGNESGLAAFSAYHKALALASVGDFESAEALFKAREAGSLQMTRSGLVARAEILSQLGRQKDAVEMIDQSFGSFLDPGVAKLRERLASGERVPFSEVRTPKDGMAEVFFTLAAALSNEANDDFTLLYSRIAEYLRPGHVGAILMSADLLEQLGQHDLAVAAYKQVPRDDPSFHVAELGRAEALRASGKTDAAVEVLEQLAGTHGNLASVQSALGDLMRQLDRFDEAVAAYDRALATFDAPNAAQWFLYYARGISKERMGDWQASETDLREALKLNPNQPQVLNYLGYSLVEHHVKLDEALDMIQRAVDAEPDSGYIVDSLGWALYRLGRYNEAVEYMERAAELMAVDPVVNDHLGDVYWAVGRKLEAEFQWQRALSFVDWEEASDEIDPERLRRKLAVGLDQVLAEEGAPPIKVANGSD